jgi:hypothetical protein
LKVAPARSRGQGGAPAAAARTNDLDAGEDWRRLDVDPPAGGARVVMGLMRLMSLWASWREDSVGWETAAAQVK